MSRWASNARRLRETRASFRKPEKGTATGERRRRRNRLSKAERANKQIARDRDGNQCRFPLCGCKRSMQHIGMKAILTVSHDVHKGMGGDPTGVRSRPEFLISLCKWRHQDGFVSRHRQTMKTRYLTPDNCNGPVAFMVDLWAVYPGQFTNAGQWFEVAAEIEPGVIGALEPRQIAVLDDLAEMDR